MPSLDKAPMTFEPIDGVAFFEREILSKPVDGGVLGDLRFV